MTVPRVAASARSLIQLSATRKTLAMAAPVEEARGEPGDLALDQRHGERARHADRENGGEGADMTGGQDDARPVEAAGDEADIVDRAEQADDRVAPAGLRRADRHQHRHQAVAREQKRQREQNRRERDDDNAHGPT